MLSLVNRVDMRRITVHKLLIGQHRATVHTFFLITYVQYMYVSFPYVNRTLTSFMTSVKSRIEEVGELYFPSPPLPSSPLSSPPFPSLPSPPLPPLLLPLPLSLEVGPLKSS